MAPFATKAWWTCVVCGHEWQALIPNRTLHGRQLRPDWDAMTARAVPHLRSIARSPKRDRRSRALPIVASE